MSAYVLQIPIQEDLEDEDRRANDAAIDGAFGEDIDRLASDVDALDSLEQELVNMAVAHDYLQCFGLTPANYSFLTAVQLLASTSVGTIAMESLSTNEGIDENTQIACEALSASIKEKAAAWGAKILSFANKAATSIMRAFTPIITKIASAGTTLGNATWDAAGAAGRTIKAHPYKTIMITLAAVAAVVGVVMIVSSGLPIGTVTNGALRSFVDKFNSLVQKVKMPGVKLLNKALPGADVSIAQIQSVETIAPVSDSVGALGWTKNAVKAIGAQVSANYKKIATSVKTIYTSILKPIEDKVAKVLFLPKDVAEIVKKKSGSRIAAWATEKVGGGIYYAFLKRVFSTVYGLIKNVVLKAFTMIKNTFSALTPAVA